MKYTIAILIVLGTVSEAPSVSAQGRTSAAATILSVDPSTFVQGSPTLALIVRGTGFNSKSQIRINGEHRQTTLISATQLKTSLLQADVAVPRNSSVSVFTPGAGETRALNVEITRAAAPTVGPPPATVSPPPPAPTMSISGIEPSSAIPGAQGLSFTVGIRGAGFTNGMTVKWNGVTRNTSFLASSLVSTFVSSTDIASMGAASVTVFDPATGSETPATTFYVDASKSGIPRITALGKTTTIAALPAAMAVNGDGFVIGSVIRVNGVDVPANKVSLNGARILGVTIPATMIPTPGTYRITVFNAGINGGESNAALLTVTAP